MFFALFAIVFIPNPDNKSLVDHIDRDPTNNHINNLRFVTKKENEYNKGIRKDNTSGFRGVVYNERADKYQAEIRIYGKKKHLGYFKSEPGIGWGDSICN